MNMIIFYLQLIPLQGPLKTMLQLSVVPLINSKLKIQMSSKLYFISLICAHLMLCHVFLMSDYTKRGVQIPLPDGIDFIEEVVEYHNVSETFETEA